MEPMHILSIYSSLYRCIKLTLNLETVKEKYRNLFDANRVNVGATKVTGTVIRVRVDLSYERVICQW